MDSRQVKPTGIQQTHPDPLPKKYPDSSTWSQGLRSPSALLLCHTSLSSSFHQHSLLNSTAHSFPKCLVLTLQNLFHDLLHIENSWLRVFLIPQAELVLLCYLTALYAYLFLKQICFETYVYVIFILCEYSVHWGYSQQ